MTPPDHPSHPADRPLHTASLLSIGSELTVGDTRDTNAGDLARSLTDAGLTVRRITALPDRLDVVAAAIGAALEEADLVVSTGGLGPTPDDLTREAIASVCGESPAVDRQLERWLRDMWARRGIPFPETNLKQAWRIPSADALPNPNGTAPGWYVGRPDGRVLVALPGPPREMQPMWRDEVLPRLRERPGGLGAEVAARTYRLTGIGESQVAEILGAEMLREPDPEVATYARAEAVDVRISAVGRPGRPAADAVAAAATVVEDKLGRYIWSTGATTWSDAIGASLIAHGWDLAVAELDVGGHLATLLGDVDWLRRVEILRRGAGTAATGNVDAADRDGAVLREARDVRERSGAAVGLAVDALDRGGDTDVAVAVVSPHGEHVEHRTAFLGGRNGRSRAALASAAALFAVLRDGSVEEASGSAERG